MGQGRLETVLFLGTANHNRARFAEILFNSIAENMGVPWKSHSRGLAVPQGTKKTAMAEPAVKALTARGIHALMDTARPPMQVTSEDLEGAARIIALNYKEHFPLLQEQFPGWVDQVEFWNIDSSEPFPLIESQVNELMARLLGGGGMGQPAEEVTQEEVCPQCQQPRSACVCVKKRKASTIRIGRETKGRRGKGVTTVFDLPLDEAGMVELAAHLKQKCGTGGTVKEGRIEIQGDQRERIITELEKMGYKVKRTGG